MAIVNIIADRSVSFASLLSDFLFLSYVDLFINSTQLTSVASYYRNAVSRKVSDEKKKVQRSKTIRLRTIAIVPATWFQIDRSIYYHRSKVMALDVETPPPSSERGNNGTREFLRCVSDQCGDYPLMCDLRTCCFRIFTWLLNIKLLLIGGFCRLLRA